ncbi:hypothetical protein HWI79_2783 [Cryptosporidium felis]|nr:hypothetical protein HWI79_2783 [Cryptosporidium felis]
MRVYGIHGNQRPTSEMKPTSNETSLKSLVTHHSFSIYSISLQTGPDSPNSCPNLKSRMNGASALKSCHKSLGQKRSP